MALPGGNAHYLFFNIIKIGYAAPTHHAMKYHSRMETIPTPCQNISNYQ